MSWNKGISLTQEHRQKISAGGRGLKRSAETRRRISIAQTTHNTAQQPGVGAKISAALKGRKPSLETRLRMSRAHRAHPERNPNWKGGITKGNNFIRSSFEYKFWRVAVFERDRYTCVWCGIRGNQTGGALQADHIKPFAYFPELRFAIDNGRTLCKPCHRKTDTWGAGIKRLKK